MNKNTKLMLAGLGTVIALSGCQSTDHTYKEACPAPISQAWEEMEWKDVVLQLPEAVSETRYSDTFLSADQTGELAGLELVVDSREGEWGGGSYRIEYYEVIPELEIATMFHVHHVDQLMEEYMGSKETLSYSPPEEIMQKEIVLGEEPGERRIQESETYQRHDGKAQKYWEFIRDPYNRWRLYVTAGEEPAADIFSQISQSIRLKEIPNEIEKDEIIVWGDLEVQMPIALTQTVSNRKFRETCGDNIDYLYTINAWEGELDGNTCVLTYYAVSSEPEVVSNYYWTPHLISYSADSVYGNDARQKKAEKLTYTFGEDMIVRDGRYPRDIYVSYGYMNEDKRPLRTWWYTQNPYDMWELEIIATEDRAEELFGKVDDSMKLK